jgi:sugar-specific transcriptional regulator TrmB
MKILTFLLLTATIGHVQSQDLINSLNHYIKKEIHKDFRKELQLELDEVFAQIGKLQKIKPETQENWFIIRGLDIQNRCSYGRLWNSNFTIHFNAESFFEKNKIVKRTIKTSISDSANVTENFNLIFKNIENGDFDFLVKYAQENKVFSGVHWLIIRMLKHNDKYLFEDITINDFDRIK